jgi:hypothetical protein
MVEIKGMAEIKGMVDASSLTATKFINHPSIHDS